jgi:Lon protease-like protein
MSSASSDTLALFPLSHGVFPDGQLRLQIFEPRYLDLIKRCQREQAPFGVVWLKLGREVQIPGDAPEFYATGCLAHIRSYVEIQPALLQIICQGGLRFELLASSAGPYGVWQGQVRYLPCDPEVALPPQHQVHADRLGRVIAHAQGQGVADRLPWFAPYKLDDAGWLANRYAEALPLESALKVALLAEVDPLMRLNQVLQALPPLPHTAG